MESGHSWQDYRNDIYYNYSLKLMVDISKMGSAPNHFSGLASSLATAYKENAELENGALANVDERRMVGHYWLRDTALAPDREIAEAIAETQSRIMDFAYQIHRGEITGSGGNFKYVLVIGIGGSSLGARFVSAALSGARDRMQLYFIDNTDPDGIDRVMAQVGSELGQTLVLVISKSGGTLETRNGMEEVRRYYAQSELDLAEHAVAVTLAGSRLDDLSRKERWLNRFPMWDWVGGRTSVFSVAGLLPLALQGIDIELFLKGARECDRETRRSETAKNPAALLAAAWYGFTRGQGGKEMVILPYKDRLALFSPYLQQLVMESLGKALDRDGKKVHQGITVFGSKGSTDQHSYVQQLLEGPDNFFVTFVEVLKDREKVSPVIKENSTSGDYLQASLYGTRAALAEGGRDSVTITLESVDEFSLGVLIALFERAVGFYASLINVNAYDQPAVEQGKKNAARLIELKNDIVNFLTERPGKQYTVEELAGEWDRREETELIFKILLHLAANPESGVKVNRREDIFSNRYWI